MERALFGKTAAGQTVESFVLRNKNGMEVWCSNYGCRITHLFLPAAGGKVDVVLGYDTVAGYENDTGFLGAFIGRYANRIGGAGFDLGGRHYSLLQNEGQNYLHGSWHSRVFEAQVTGDNSLSFIYTSPDGEDGFPGAVEVAVGYTLTDDNELLADYWAVPAAATHLNLTNHSYFNLAGVGSTVLGHNLQLNCDTFLEVDAAQLPTGRVLETAGGAFDFLQPKPIGQNIEADDPQLKIGGGYDHCFIINRQQPALAQAAAVTHPQSGRWMRLYTSQPAVQLYTGNSLGPHMVGKGEVPLVRHGAFCLETQHYPDSPNHPDFPTTLVQAGEKYHHAAVFQFGW